jgi:hypothetical protein
MQPGLLEMIFMLRIPDIGEMGMKDKKEITPC